MGDAGPATRSLDEILALEACGDDVFATALSGFGGETLGCATRAAARTCPAKRLHSLHTYFLRPVPPERRVEFAVERLRDGRRTAHRRVQVREGARLLCELVASFAGPAEGVEYQDARFDPATPGPEELPDEAEVAQAEGLPEDEGALGGPLEWRFVGGTPWSTAGTAATSRYVAWVRPRLPLASEPELGAAVLAFLSDYHSHMAVARKLGARFEPVGFSSLDQVLWVHRDFGWDDWKLITTESDVAFAGRAHTRRMLYARDGRLLVSMAQEQLVAPDP